MKTFDDVVLHMYYPFLNTWDCMSHSYICYLTRCHMSEIAHDMIIDGNY